MKLRPLFILLLFVASAGILVWIYHTAKQGRRETKDAPWAQTVADLDATCRSKHVKSIQYDHFSSVAGEEQHPDASRLFRAMALAERVQENNCANAILRLGGTYTPPDKVTVFRGTTDSNLERSIAYERQLLSENHGAEIDRAIAKGNRYAARVLIWANAGDLQHVILMERSRAGEARNTKSYLVCPVCGNLYPSEYTDAYCPHCLTDGRKFIRFD